MNRLQLAGTSVLVAGLTLAAVPPALVNYQGVLRDNLGNPLSGTYDMVFRFHSADLGGDEILVDSHTGGAAIAVSGGLFNVQLGSGTVSDGSGPGAYTSLAGVFANYADVWLAVQVGAEVLSPRTRIVAAGYALNARSLEGRTAAQFLDTSSTVQAKYGVLAISAPAGTPGVALQATGPGGGIIALDTDGGGQAWIGQGPFGVDAFGFGAVGGAGGRFVDSSGTGQAYLGFGDYGIDAFGSWPSGAGGRFNDTVYSGEAFLAHGDTGIDAYGTYAGGIFRNGTSASYTDEAYLAFGDIGVQGYGDVAGGLFSDRNNSGRARLGYADRGIDASGLEAGGYFELPGLGLFDPPRAFAYAARASGTSYGGVEGFGESWGGRFEDTDDGSWAYLGAGGYGVSASGPFTGGVFYDSDSAGTADIAAGGYGVKGFGSFDESGAGGYFTDLPYSGHAYVGIGDTGIDAYGSYAGGIFRHLTTLGYDTEAYLSFGSYTLYGNGTKAFVQNHPYEADKLIAYNALEGDEVGTYTRGTARLERGEARITLGETFRWVTNPDLGLTAHLTARGAAVPLYVESLSTTELVVRGPEDTPDVAFDYLVAGLRVGFERVSVVQAKHTDAPIPSMEAHEREFAARPELARHTAEARFLAMERKRDPDKQQEQAGAAALQFAIGMAAAGRERAVADAQILSPENRASHAERVAAGPAADRRDPEVDRPSPPGAGQDRRERPRPTVADAVGTTTIAAVAPGLPAGSVAVPIGESVLAGDVLANDLSSPGTLRRAGRTADPGVAGIVAGEAGTLWSGIAPIALAGTIVTCKVDASYGSIQPNDLLMASPTPGHAMRVGEGAMQGTVIGKALEPLADGTGAIRVLVMSR